MAGERQGERARRKTLAERFVAFHTSHPEVYVSFRRHARRLRWNGHRRLSAQYICDYLSFETPVDMRPAGQFYKIDHDFGPFYARMLISEDHSYRALFELRPSVADSVDVAALARVA